MDRSPIREANSLFTIDVDIENDVAFIESTLSTKLRSFVHKYDSENRYSCTMFDILVVDYLKTSACPVMRMWITYCADDAFMNINSASFIIDGKKYTFTGIGNSDWYTQDENGYVEEVLIKFGEDNIDFIAALAEIFSNTDDMAEAARNATGKLILHGREDIEVDLGEGFFLDFLVISMGWMDIKGLDFINKVSSITMKITDLD